MNVLPLVSRYDRGKLARAPRPSSRRSGSFGAGESRAPTSTRLPTVPSATWCGLQEPVGCDLITDGELRRDNFYSFVADKFVGVRLMTLSRCLTS